MKYGVLSAALDTLTSWRTVGFTIIAVGYAFISRTALGQGAVHGSAEIFAVFLADSTLVFFILAPLWMLMSAVETLRTRSELELIRAGSTVHWVLFAGRKALIQATPIVLGVAAAAGITSIGTTPSWDWLGVTPIVSAGAITYDLELSPVALGTLELLSLLFAAVALRIALAGVAVILQSRVVLMFVVFVLFAFGAITASGIPVPDLVTFASWATAASPLLSAEVFGSWWGGLVVIGLVSTAIVTVVAIKEFGLRQLWSQLLARFSLLYFVGSAAGLAVLIAVFTPLTGNNFWSLVLTTLQGTQADQVGVALAPFFFAVLVYLAPTYRMVAVLEDELDGWLLLAVIRSGSARRWAMGFIARESLRAVVALGALALSMVLAFALVSTSEPGAAYSGPDPVILVYQFAINGILQMTFYAVFIFVLVSLTGYASAGLFGLGAIIVFAFINPAVGSVFPFFLNSLAHAALGWERVTHDTLLLVIWLAAACIAFLIAVRKNGSSLLNRRI